ncbi:MAG: glycerol-3-phosphate dehydrogenase [Hyphomicrobium sp.]
MPETVYDIAIVGGGINGVGIAADAAGRGLKVLLAEMGDLGGATSSASSKLIHGGLRYLEHMEFRLVRESLREREVLLAKAPHIIWPLRFVLPHVAGMRPAPLIRAGLFLYDHLAKRRCIPGSSRIDLRRDAAGRALRPELASGFAYWDCWVDDARLVVLNARAAANRGASILTRTKVTGATISGGLWHLTLDGQGAVHSAVARAVVNACGPWAGDAARKFAPPEGGQAQRLRLVKGSHIVVPRIPGADDAYLMQSEDRRAVFALPFEERFTLIGTTDVAYSGDPAAAAISPDEVHYLLALPNRFFRSVITPADIVWQFSGVRPLQDDEAANPSAVSRDYKLDLVAGDARPALLHVIGGKVTTHRKLAEEALDILTPHLPPMGPAWTAGVPLPGGAVGDGGIAGYRSELLHRRPWLGPERAARYVRRYGTLTDELLGDARRDGDLGLHIGGGLTEREVAYLKAMEWAARPDDVLWRRTKTGLHLSPADRPQAEERIAKLL